jgi:uncharacterized protein YecE (DUF72 family)
MSRMASGKCYIGTSGWSYRHWAQGRFYPRGMKPGEWLAFFAQQFSTVEINSSFYRLPKPGMFARWRGVTPTRFRFAVKLWRWITHLKKLKDCETELANFFAVAGELGPKFGPLLVQLPPSLGKDAARLDDFLTQLHTVSRLATQKRARRRLVTVEFRNPEWLCDEVYRLLTRHRAAVCLADLPRCPIVEPNEAPFVYLRRHGPRGAYRGCYAPEHIAADAARTRAWLAAGKDVYVYYNNDIGGHAVDNARQLTAAVGDLTG